jgi:hypothetical protein
MFRTTREEDSNNSNEDSTAAYERYQTIIPNGAQHASFSQLLLLEARELRYGRP